MKTILTLILFGALTFAAEPVVSEKTDETKLARLAESAETPQEHMAVAKLYRERAERSEEKAAAHEAAAVKLDRKPKPPMAYKWPSMVSDKAARERRLAMQERRAAEESKALAAKHTQKALEIHLASRSE